VDIALFGGTFDPIHAGHTRAAQAAARKFRLGQILFVPAGSPPHKYRGRLTSFAHRFAMVALACAADERFVPSLLEAPKRDGQPHYSIDTARAARRSLQPKDRLFFLLGVDAFLDLPHWKAYRRLLELVNFIVVSRPGFEIDRILEVVPQKLIHHVRGREEVETIRMQHTSVHVLPEVEIPVASRDIREAVGAGRRITGLVPPLVEEYIRKECLYRPSGAL